MPMVIPIVIAVAADVSFIAVAGAVLTAVGAVTGNKDLMKVGAVLSIGGGLASMASGLAEGASTAASEAAGEAAAESASQTAAGEFAGGVASSSVESGGQAAVRSVDNAIDAANAAEAGGTTTLVPGNAGGDMGASLARPATTTVTPTVSTQSLDATLPQTGVSVPLAKDAVVPTVTPEGASALSGDAYSQYQNSMLEAGQRNLAGIAKDGTQAGTSPLQQWLDKLMGGAQKVGTFIKDNKELVQLGGQALQSMYGPQAEQMDFQKSVYERQRQNLNNPVRLYYKKGS